jgi:hypothetical protein
MTPEAQLAAIASACPKLACKNINGEWVWREQQSRRFDPLNDLNAMHEVEKVLVEHHGLYWFALAEVVSGFKREEFDYGNEYFLKDIACATAAQRAEAFLRTLNLWKE